MQKSESIKAIAGALAVFHSNVGTIKKDAKNPFFKSNYASLSNILDEIQDPLQEAGLVFSQFPDGDDSLTTILVHAESGEFFQASNTMKAKANDPQALGSAITYSRRYVLGAVLGLNIETDDDGNAASKPQGGATAGAGEKKDFPEDNRPWITDELVNKGIERMKSGETGVFDKCVDSFKMSKVRREMLKGASTNANIKGN